MAGETNESLGSEADASGGRTSRRRELVITVASSNPMNVTLSKDPETGEWHRTEIRVHNPTQASHVPEGFWGDNPPAPEEFTSF